MILSFIRLFERKILFMKKTKILVPAMAVLALGMAAAVTGTVAWYSSTNIVYANGISIKSKTAQSLQIALTSAGTWGTSVDHTALMKTDVNPAYCLEEAGTLEAAPSFVYLDQGKVDDPGTGEGQDKWYVNAAGKVCLFSNNEVVLPAAQAESNPWLNEARDSGGQMLNVQTDSDFLKLDTTVTTASETVKAVVTLGRTAVKNIDKALVFGFYNVQTKLWEVSKPFASEEGMSATINNLTNFTVTPTATEYQFYMWYDGEDPVTINENAIANPITATITYSIVSTNP